MNKINVIIIMGALPSKLQTLPSSLKENQVIKMVNNNKIFFFHQRSIQTGIRNNVINDMFRSILPRNNIALNIFTNEVANNYQSTFYVTEATVNSEPMLFNVNVNDFDIRKYIMGFIRSRQLNIDDVIFTVQNKSIGVKFGNKVIKERKKVLKEIEKNLKKLRKLNNLR